MTQQQPTSPWLITITALSLVTVLFMLGHHAYRTAGRMAADEFNRRQLLIATEAANGIVLHVEILANSLRALSRDLSALSNKQGLVESALQRKYDELTFLGVNDIGLIGSDGILQANVNAPELVGQDFSWRKYFREAGEAQTGSSYGVEFIEFKGVEAGELGVLISVPLIWPPMKEPGKDPPTGNGVVVGTLRLDSIAERFIVPIGASGSGQAFLLDEKLDLLWDEDASRTGKNFLTESADFQKLREYLLTINDHKLGSTETTYFAFNPDRGRYDRTSRERRLLAYSAAALGQQRWTVGVWAPKDESRRLILSVYQAQAAVIGLSMLITIVGAALALTSSHRLAKSLRKEVATNRTELSSYHAKLETTDRRHRHEIDRAGQLAATGEIAAGVAHEIKNPICGIRDALKVILAKHENIQERHILEEMLLQADRVDKTVQDLLDFARPKALSFRPLNLHVVLHQVVEFSRDRFRHDGIGLTEVFHAGDPTVSGDRDLMKQVFLNLLMNAAQACAEDGGRVDVTTERDDERGTIEVRVKDNGAGISTDVAAQIFQPFFTTKSNGTGLGLPLSRSIIRQHGGEISIESQPGQGTEITVALPAHLA
ncbi:MAG: hypothetical protein GY906_27055 [bacterium]|nr:hypothetical protein [bacterium]